MSKDSIMLEYLLTCPSINENSLFFNYAEGEDNTSHFITEASDKSTQKPYVDGSIKKRYSFDIIVYKSLGYTPIDTTDVTADENLDELSEVQAIIDWITEQGELRNFPNFGDKIEVDEMYCTTDKPVLRGVFTDTMGTPMARYSITIQIDYLDKTKMIWS